MLGNTASFLVVTALIAWAVLAGLIDQWREHSSSSEMGIR